jgi:hypothetical protein
LSSSVSVLIPINANEAKEVYNNSVTAIEKTALALANSNANANIHDLAPSMNRQTSYP